MLMHITSSGQIHTSNDEIKITIVDDEKRNTYVLSHIPSSAKITQSKKFMKIVIDKNTIHPVKRYNVGSLDISSHIAEQSDDNKLSEHEYNEILLNNLGFDVDHNTSNKLESDPHIILNLGVKAVNGNQLDFAKKLLHIAWKNGMHKVAQQLLSLITKKRETNESHKSKQQ